MRTHGYADTAGGHSTPDGYVRGKGGAGMVNNPNGTDWTTVQRVAAGRADQLRDDAERFQVAAARCIVGAAELERTFNVGRGCPCGRRGCDGAGH